MRGKYIISQDGHTLAEVENMLTSSARFAILQYLAGENNAWASAVAVGAFSNPPAVTDERLGFEVGRGLVVLKESNFTDNSITVKAVIPRGVVAEIHELGLYSSPSQTGRDYDQMLFSDFNPDQGDAIGVVAEPGRIGPYGSRLDIDTDGTATARFRQMGMDISALGGQDKFILAYNADGVDTIEIRMMNSMTDYMVHTFTPQDGYNSEEWEISQFDVVGQGTLLRPFIEIQVVATSTTGGTLVLDGLRGDDTDVFDDQMLVSRAVLDTPILKVNSTELEIEYSLRFDF